MARDNMPKQAPMPRTPEDLRFRSMAYLAAQLDKADRAAMRAENAMHRARADRERFAAAMQLRLNDMKGY